MKQNLLKEITDPFKLLENELTHLKKNLKNLIGTHHSNLNSTASYYFSEQHQGKLIRPLIILLISKATFSSIATSTTTSSSSKSKSQANQYDFINQSISNQNILNDLNPLEDNLNKNLNSIQRDDEILPTQKRLAEIAELIHVSSLLHDDVIDQAKFRRGRISAPELFGSKLTVLAGDFLLSRASLALSRLANFEVIELISSIISNLVQGELVQLDSILKSNSSSNQVEIENQNQFNSNLFHIYERKNYLKTASLIAKTCRAAVILSNFEPNQIQIKSQLIESSYRFGKHFGLSFQIIDDILDYTSAEEQTGKTSSLSDLKSGLITAPGLFAWQKFGHSFEELVSRQFSHDGDLDLAQNMIKESKGIEKSYELARNHIDLCFHELNQFQDSDSKECLIELCNLVINRKN